VIGRSVSEIDHIFITHCHADHCGLAGSIKEISGAVIHLSEIGKQIIQNDRSRKQGADTVKSFYVEQGIAEESVNAYLVFLRYFRKATAPFQVDECLDFQTEYAIGDTAFTVLETPGHARDHVCYFFRKEGILLSGDHILPESTFNLRPDLLCTEFRPLGAMLDSLARIEDLPIGRVLPAHGTPFSNLQEIAKKVRRHHREKKQLIREVINEGPQTAFEISKNIFGIGLPGFDLFLALNETYVHLVELMRDGTVEGYKKGKQVLYIVH